MSHSQAAFTFKDFDAELYFARRLAEHRCRAFEGVTTPEITRERIRAAILEAKLDQGIIGRNSLTKKPETYAQCFERHFGEPLIAPQRKGNR
jgi:hypothetical protein